MRTQVAQVYFCKYYSSTSLDVELNTSYLPPYTTYSVD